MWFTFWPDLAGSFAQEFHKATVRVLDGLQFHLRLSWGKFCFQGYQSHWQNSISLWPVGAECLSPTDHFQFPVYGPLCRKFAT